jgi:hypothetical protein
METPSTIPAGQVATSRLVGIVEISRIFELSVAEAWVLARLAEFPRPSGEICDELVWRREEVARWRRRNPDAGSAHETGTAGAGG